MNTHSKAKLTARSRAKTIRRIIVLHQPIAQVAVGFGISERCAYSRAERDRLPKAARRAGSEAPGNWRARFHAQGAATWQNFPLRLRSSATSASIPAIFSISTSRNSLASSAPAIASPATASAITHAAPAGNTSTSPSTTTAASPSPNSSPTSPPQVPSPSAVTKIRSAQ